MSFRLIPVLIVAAALTLSVKVGDLWRDFGTQGQPDSTGAHAEEPGVGHGDFAMEPAAGTPATEEAGAAGDRPAAGGQFVPWSIEPAGHDDRIPERNGEGSESETQAVKTTTLRDPYEFTDEEIELLQQLSARREEIEEHGREIDQREALLSAAEERIDQKVGELEALRRAIEELVVQHNDQEESQLRSLVKIYENMKPKEAARIFEELDLVVLLEVIDRMSERKAAPVLARLSPDRAKEITLELAKRRDLPMAKE